MVGTLFPYLLFVNQTKDYGKKTLEKLLTNFFLPRRQCLGDNEKNVSEQLTNGIGNFLDLTIFYMYLIPLLQIFPSKNFESDL